MPESRPKRRWFHITPDRLIVGLLAVEGCLLLSEWFQWFAFNEKKGYTVLMAVAAVCLVVVVMLLWLVVSLLFRWRFQFSLRSLVVLVVAVAVPLGWFGVKLREAERQRRAVEGIREAGGWVFYYDDPWDNEGRRETKPKPPTPTWLTELVGEDFCADVVAVSFSLLDTGLEQHDEQAFLLRRVYLLFLQPPNAGLEHVKGLKELKHLWLSDIKITDEGLENLIDLTKLGYLNLDGTFVTKEGVERLRMALPDCEMIWEEKHAKPPSELDLYDSFHY